jgi:hypothetical protein
MVKRSGVETRPWSVPLPSRKDPETGREVSAVKSRPRNEGMGKMTEGLCQWCGNPREEGRKFVCDSCLSGIRYRERERGITWNSQASES